MQCHAAMSFGHCAGGCDRGGRRCTGRETHRLQLLLLVLRNAVLTAIATIASVALLTTTVIVKSVLRLCCFFVLALVLAGPVVVLFIH